LLVLFADVAAVHLVNEPTEIAWTLKSEEDSLDNGTADGSFCHGRDQGGRSDRVINYARDGRLNGDYDLIRDVAAPRSLALPFRPKNSKRGFLHRSKW
jgi:hypothetical protein